MENEQAVVDDTDVQEVPDTEDSNAQDDDLDSLLEEYSSSDEPKETETKETVANSNDESETKQLLNLLKQEREDSVQKAAKRELNDTVSSIKGELGVKDDFVKAFLNVKAENNPKLRQAYINKESNPKAWSKIEKILRGELKEFITGNSIDKGATDIRNAVTASVLNSKSIDPDTQKTSKDLAQMNDADFENYKNNVFKVGRGL